MPTGKYPKAGRSPRYMLSFALLWIMLGIQAETGKKFNIHIQNQTFGQVIALYKDLYQVSFVFSEEDVPATPLFSFRLQDAALEDALTALCNKLPLAYKKIDTHIIFYTDVQTGIPSRHREKWAIRGTVTDENKLPLIGANIRIGQSLKGTTTDEKGFFELSVYPDEVLICSYIGHKTQNIIVGNESFLQITLPIHNQLMEEVSVTAMGIERPDRSLSYPIQSLNESDICMHKTPNVINTLTGKIAGISVNASAAGPGAATRIVMRGLKSIRDENNILYVIDGIPVYNHNQGSTNGFYSLQPRGEYISDIHPEDIQEITVLTGPMAAALYGSAGAQGVVLINTKRGHDGRIRIDLTQNTSFSKPRQMFRFQNSYINRPGQYKSWGAKQVNSDPGQDDYFQTGSVIMNHIALSLGTVKNQSYVSAGTTHANGSLPGNTYKRYNIAYRNISHFLQDRITLDAYGSYIIQEDQNMMAQGEYYNPLVPVYLYPRGEDFAEVRSYEYTDETRRIPAQNWKWGDQGLNMQNPYWIAKRNLYGTKKDRYIINLALKINLTEWMNLNGRVRIDNAYSTFERKNYATTLPLFAGDKGFYEQTRTETKQIYTDAFVQMNKQYGPFSVAAVTGASLKHVLMDMAGAQGALRDMPNLFNFHNIDFINGRDSYSKQRGWQEQLQSLFVRSEIGWRNKWFVNLTLRNEWSSALARTRQMSYMYPSAGTSVILSEWLQLPDFISFLQLRAAYASVGSPVPRHLSQPGYGYKPELGNWETQTFRPLERISPERTSSAEAGFTLRLLNNLLSWDLTAYRSYTRNQFIRVPISPSSGYDSMYAQGGNVRNTGFESAIGLQKSGSDFHWSLNLNFSYNQNQIVSLLDHYFDPATQKNYTVNEIRKGDILLKPGGSLGDLYAFRKLKRDTNGYIWVDPATSNVVVEELAKPELMGSVLPKSYLGLRQSLQWKRLSFQCLVTARIGGIVQSYTQALLDQYGVSSASAIARDQGGVQVNSSLINAEDYFKVVGGKRGDQTKYIYPADNLRLQEVSVGYQLPRHWFADKLRARIAITGRNLWLIYCKAPFDPELTASTGTYNQGVDYFMQPGQREFGFDIRIQF